MKLSIRRIYKLEIKNSTSEIEFVGKSFAHSCIVLYCEHEKSLERLGETKSSQIELELTFVVRNSMAGCAVNNKYRVINNHFSFFTPFLLPHDKLINSKLPLNNYYGEFVYADSRSLRFYSINTINIYA